MRVAVGLCALLLLSAPASLAQERESEPAPRPTSKPSKPTKPGPSKGEAPAWQTNVEAAKRAAKDTKRPVLVYVSGSDWCEACKLLEAEVLSTAAFEDFAKAVILLKVDLPKAKILPPKVLAANRRFAQGYGVEGFPSVFLIDAAGARFGKAQPYKAKAGVTPYVRQLASLIKDGFDAKTGLAKPTPQASWHERWPAASAEARQAKKPVLVVFTGSDWCHYCKLLDREVFRTQAFVTWAKKSVVLLELDYPARKPQPKDLVAHNEALRKKHKVEGFPVVLLLDADGKQLGGALGYAPGGVKVFLHGANKILGAAGKKQPAPGDSPSKSSD